MAEARPRTVVIAAAATNVDRCESEPAMANAVNATAPAALARAAHRIGAKTVFVSTEYVFDGEAGPYDEDAEPRPLSVYGSSKAAGEQAVLSADPDAIVVRTTVVYGPERQGRNFAYRLAGHLRAGKVLRVPSDQISTPTYNRDLATALVQLAQSSLRGIVHVAGPCLLGRDGFAVEVAREAGLDGTLIESVKTASLSQVARRPLRAGLISRRANEWGSHPVRGTAAAVADWRGDTYGLTWP
jgi:dTDP-4-dehydrorhamnose reductase